MKSLKMNRSLWAGALVAGLAVTTSGVVLAQPGGNEAPRGRQGGQGGRGGFGNMTPEQREQQMQQRREEGLRRSLTDAGFIAKDVQDAVVAYAVAQDKERNASQEKVRELSAAVREGTDEEVVTLLAAVRADAAAAKARRDAALTELDTKIGFRRNARLEAILVLSGLTGEEIAPMGGRGGFGGPGGPGGQGGGRGGRGGRGGGQGGPGGPGGGQQ